MSRERNLKNLKNNKEKFETKEINQIDAHLISCTNTKNI